MYQLLASLVVMIHLLFVLFVLFGGLLVLRWRRIAWLHLPAAAWGVLVEFTGWICPLTPLEHWLRTQEGAAGYDGDFVLHYLLPILYPEGLTHNIQLILGALVLIVNIVIYGWIWQARKQP